MDEETLIHGGTVVSDTGLSQTDVLVRGQVIAALGSGLLAQPGARRLDANGCLVFPGFIDLHVHVAEKIGGYDLADDFESATRLALQNGVTCLCAFAHQSLGTVEEALDQLLGQARGKAHCDFSVHLAPTRFDEDTHKDLANLARKGARTIKLYTTYREAGLYADPLALRSILELAAKLGLRVLVHCEDDAIVTAFPQRPIEAEVRAIEALSEAVIHSRAKAHVVHVSSPQGLDAARKPRASGLLTVETCPHYLVFDEQRRAEPLGHRYLCSPPLRSLEQKQALVSAVGLGQVDALATDHCPFAQKDKDRHAGDRAQVPRGLPGLGALVPVAFDMFMAQLGPVGLMHLLSRNPARIAGLYPRKGMVAPGSDADLCVLRLDGQESSVRSTLGRAHDPYADRKTTLEIRHVLTRGRCAVLNGQQHGAPMHGRLAWNA
ncbi:MAG: amidohydrolase family protein [Myxococcota bacterium]|jgi:dihydropyrimidinase|nr:amidohydrolase family protein [Myxococcota bacterium]